VTSAYDDRVNTAKQDRIAGRDSLKNRYAGRVHFQRSIKINLMLINLTVFPHQTFSCQLYIHKKIYCVNIVMIEEVMTYFSVNLVCSFT